MVFSSSSLWGWSKPTSRDPADCFQPELTYHLRMMADLSSIGKWENEIKTEVRRALDIADTAYRIMRDNANDAKVERTAKCLLGQNDFQNKFDKVKGRSREIHVHGLSLISFAQRHSKK